MQSGEVVTNVDLDPGLVNIKIPVYENLQNRTVPVNPTVTGTPGAGFRISSVEVAPLVVTVEGDLDQLQALVAADTAPVAVSGATRDVTAEVAYALPTGVTPVGAQTARVTVHIQPVTETRTFTAGIRLDGRQPDLLYEPSETQVLLTLYGSSADLDRLDTSPIVISLNVAALEPGVNERSRGALAAVGDHGGRDLARDRHRDRDPASHADAVAGDVRRARPGSERAREPRSLA